MNALRVSATYNIGMFNISNEIAFVSNPMPLSAFFNM